ncbi:MAG: ParA family protein, partial [Myxococcota bacterium]
MTARGVVAVAGNKGGIGKTTLAVNLAVLLRSRCPELPVLLLGLDDQDLIDRMFGEDENASGPDIADALRSGALRPAIRAGRFGVHWVPTSARIGELKREIETPRALASVLARCDWPGVTLIDTKSDLEELTQNALWASDLTLLPVTDQTSLREVAKVFERFDAWGRPRDCARIVLSLVDLRIKYADADHGDVLALLVAQIRSAGLPLLESFLSRSPSIEALHTNTGGRPLPVSEQAPRSLVHVQLQHLADELLRALEGEAIDMGARAERRGARRRACATRLVAFPEQGAELIEVSARDCSASGLGAAEALPCAVGTRLHVALRDANGRPALRWARVVRSTGLRFEDEPPAAALIALCRPAQE